MSFWSRRSRDAETQPSTQTERRRVAQNEPPEDAEFAQRVLDSLVFALRSWGQFPVSPSPEAEGGESGPSFESWAQQTARAIGAEPDEPAPNWDGLDRFVLEQRKGEQRSVSKTVGDLREALWAFVECFSRANTEDQSADERSGKQVARLREVVAGTDVVAIKREAILAAQSITASINARQHRQKTHVEKLSAKLAHVSAELVRAQRDSTTDPLTGVYNRAALDAHLKRLAEINVLLPMPPLLFVLDIDHFKWANDSYGHEVGDQLLRQLAARLRATCRDAEDFVARFGGDEFLIVVENAEPRAEISIAERVLFALREIEIATSGEPLRVSASIGSARCRPGDTPEEWFRRADQALYQAKHAGRDRHVSGDVKSS